MPSFGERSTNNLITTHQDLQRLFNEVVKTYDCAVICGNRNKEEQDLFFSSGASKLEWPNSKHNVFPSLAVDIVPWPIDWNDKKRFYHFAGYVWRTAENLGILVSWGGDWNRNLNLNDQYFFDLPHWELIKNE